VSLPDIHLPNKVSDPNFFQTIDESAGEEELLSQRLQDNYNTNNELVARPPVDRIMFTPAANYEDDKLQKLNSAKRKLNSESHTDDSEDDDDEEESEQESSTLQTVTNEVNRKNKTDKELNKITQKKT